MKEVDKRLQEPAPTGTAGFEGLRESMRGDMTDEDIAKRNMDYICYSTPVQAVADSLENEDARAYAVMNPAQEVIDRCEFFHDITDAMEMYEAVWMEIRLVR